MNSPSVYGSLLSECRKLFLKDYSISARIGIHDFELSKPQRLLINVELFVPLNNSTPCADAIDEVVDYDFIRKVVSERVSRGHINLQETLVDDVIDELLKHPGVRAALVSSCKPDVYPDCAGVGVQVFKCKPSIN
jgi:dihydroneopterin aldolase